MNGLAAAGLADIVAIADVNPDAAIRAAAAIQGARACGDLDELLSLGVDGIVIATPNALHASQAIAALDVGVAVFCQKPLGRSASEVRLVVGTARRANRLLDVDFSYRYTDGLQKIAGLAESDVLGTLYAAELTFHNAYGPDKPWFYDRAQSGGGCVIDLGVHLIDLALWMFGRPVTAVTSRLFSGGVAMEHVDGVEDFAVVRLDFEDAATAQINCSWRLPAGRDAIIEAAFYGTRGAAKWQNVDGSFLDFVTERFDGTSTIVISQPPDDWGPRALIRWTERLGARCGFDPSVEHALDVAVVLDSIYSSPSAICRKFANRRVG
jgi:predicted dehydrogenase